MLVAALLLFNDSPFMQQMPALARAAVKAQLGHGAIEEVAQAMSQIQTGFLLSVATNAVLLVAIIADMVLRPFYQP